MDVFFRKVLPSHYRHRHTAAEMATQHCTLEEYPNLTYKVLPQLDLHPCPTSSSDGPFLDRSFLIPINTNHISSSFCRPAIPYRLSLPSANNNVASLDLRIQRVILTNLLSSEAS